MSKYDNFFIFLLSFFLVFIISYEKGLLLPLFCGFATAPIKTEIEVLKYNLLPPLAD